MQSPLFLSDILKGEQKTESKVNGKWADQSILSTNPLDTLACGLLD